MKTFGKRHSRATGDSQSDEPVEFGLWTREDDSPHPSQSAFAGELERHADISIATPARMFVERVSEQTRRSASP